MTYHYDLFAQDFSEILLATEDRAEVEKFLRDNGHDSLPIRVEWGGRTWKERWTGRIELLPNGGTLMQNEADFLRCMMKSRSGDAELPHGHESHPEVTVSIDDYLDAYASEFIAAGQKYRWWWNGCHVLADAIGSLAYHVRVDGCHALTDDEMTQLETLERYMRAYDDFGLPIENESWLHAEAMWLLGQWFSRLWD
jgi:hypothetical protein